MKLFIIITTSISSMLATNYSNNENNSHQSAQTMKQLLQSEGLPCQEGDDEEPIPILSGHVRNSSLIPIYHACVEIKSGSTQISIIGTNINGHYYFNSVPSGSYDLVLSAPGYSPQTIPIVITGSAQTINATL